MEKGRRRLRSILGINPRQRGHTCASGLAFPQQGPEAFWQWRPQRSNVGPFCLHLLVTDWTPDRIVAVAMAVNLHGPSDDNPCPAALGGGAFFCRKSVVSQPVIPKGGTEARVVWQARRVSSGDVVRRAAGAPDAGAVIGTNWRPRNRIPAFGLNPPLAESASKCRPQSDAEAGSRIGGGEGHCFCASMKSRICSNSCFTSESLSLESPGLRCSRSI